MTPKSETETYDEFINLVKREASFATLLEVIKEINADTSLSASNKSDMLKSISKVFVKFQTTVKQ